MIWVLDSYGWMVKFDTKEDAEKELQAMPWLGPLKNVTDAEYRKSMKMQEAEQRREAAFERRFG